MTYKLVVRCLILSLLVISGISPVAVAEATSNIADMTNLAEARRGMHEDLLRRDSADLGRNQASLGEERLNEACFEQSFPDPSEGSPLDVARYGVGHGCYSNPNLWTFVDVTYDQWEASQLSEHLLEIDADSNLTTGCQGYDWAAFATWSSSASALRGSMFRQPSCDSATWTITSPITVGKSSGDTIGLAFENSQIGNPTSFRWRGSLTGVSDSLIDLLPNSGSHSASGFSGACQSASVKGYYVEDRSKNLTAVLTSAGASNIRSGQGVTSFTGDPATINLALNRHDKRIKLRRDVVRGLATIPNDTQFGSQWNLPAVHAQQAWDRTTGSADVVVAVIDSGVDATHPDLAGQLLPGYDAANATALPTGNSDLQGHGTSVTGVIAAATDNNTGLASLGWRTRVLPIRAGDANGSMAVSAEVRAIRYAADQGVRVINLSLGGCAYLQSEADAVTYAQSKGALIVAAAGNESYRGTPRSYPAAFPNVIGVAATGFDGTAAQYSNTGDYVDIAAPGGSGDADATHSIAVLARGGGYRFIDGTSFSAPTVAAAAALIWSVKPSATAQEVQAALTSTAADIGVAGRDDVYGYGMLDAGRAVTSVMPPTSAPPTPTPAGSPSPSPSATQPASPAPTATSSPKPMQAAPTVALSPSVISAGQTVTVTYSGTPNTRIQVLSRTQPSVNFTQIASLMLDSSGFASSMHKPQRNTRITARAEGGPLSANAPLVEVRSVASLNATRTGTRLFRFTGRVYPARDQRVVSLYRNGVLVAQGRCDATGVYVINKTLAAGTFNFLVRTTSDSYNVGSTGPARSIRVY